MNAITYFKLNSPYVGDITKNCALTGSEVDNNFFTLEGRDVKSVELQDGKIVVNLMNGDKLTTESITEDCVKGLTIDFDEVNGILTITQNGITQTITGFATNYNVGDAISVDGSLLGNGLAKSPVGISPIAKTGQYRPVKRIVNIVDGEKLPTLPNVFPGDRYLTVENVNEFGYLYNYEGLKKIACKLRESNSGWRIPTKQDWDDMLNAVEPCQEYRTHNDARSNKFLGKFAGKLLKSKDYWKKFDGTSSCCGDDEHTCFDYSEIGCGEECHCGRHIPCHPDYCGEYGTCHHRCGANYTGLDKYGFRAIPAGYANEAKDYMYFKERAYFWTATNHEYRDAYIKAFAYNRNNVLQDIFASDNYLSVRLVKNFNGDNFNEREDILGGSYSTVLMPSLEHGKAIWTSVNIALTECACDCCCKYVLPNDGQGMEYTKRYFINEWTGKDWLRKELAEGESVVVMNETVTQVETTNNNCHCNCQHNTTQYETTYNTDYTEYRVVRGELVDVARLIYDNVMQTVQPQLDAATASIEDLSERLQQEIDRSTGQDIQHTEAIGELQARMETAEGDITDLKERMETAETNITELQEKMETAESDITDLKERMEAAEGNIQTLTEGLETEKNERQAKDEELEEAIQGLEEEVNELSDALETEKNEREAKDTELEGMMLTSDGTVFNSETGILTLKSKDGTNDIDIQFNFNFGTF